MKKKYIGYFLIGIVLFLLGVFLPFLAWTETLSKLGVGYWKVQLGWLVILGISIFTLQDKNDSQSDNSKSVEVKDV